jgi:hypothetical protein
VKIRINGSSVYCVVLGLQFAEVASSTQHPERQLGPLSLHSYMNVAADPHSARHTNIICCQSKGIHEMLSLRPVLTFI